MSNNRRLATRLNKRIPISQTEAYCFDSAALRQVLVKQRTRVTLYAVLIRITTSQQHNREAPGRAILRRTRKTPQLLFKVFAQIHNSNTRLTPVPTNTRPQQATFNNKGHFPQDIVSPLQRERGFLPTLTRTQQSSATEQLITGKLAHDHTCDTL